MTLKLCCFSHQKQVTDKYNHIYAHPKAKFDKEAHDSDFTPCHIGLY